MSKHTPAPWSIDKTTLTAINSGEKHVAMVNFYNSPNGANSVVGEEHEANTHLIAAAPDLMEALKLLYAHLFGPTTSMPRHEIDDLCVAAIAKAEGRS